MIKFEQWWEGYKKHCPIMTQEERRKMLGIRQHVKLRIVMLCGMMSTRRTKYTR